MRKGKQNEIKTVPKLLDLLDISGCIVSADAMSCQIKIAEKILSKEGEAFGVNLFGKWPELNSLVEINSERINKKTGEVETEKRYYISSSTGTAKELLQAVRGHWEVENKLHWVLDVVFREDDCRSRAGYSAENFSMLRQFALNLIRKEPSKKAIRRKQNIAGWDESFLLEILIGGQN